MDREQLTTAMVEWRDYRGYEPTVIRVRLDIWKEIQKWTHDAIGGFAHDTLSPAIYLLGCRVEVIAAADAPELEFEREVRPLDLPTCTPVELLRVVMHVMENCRNSTPLRVFDRTQETADIIRRYLLTMPGQHIDEEEPAGLRTRVVDLT